MIRAEGLVRRFGGRTVVDGVSFDVAPGEVVALLGPNGAGKTTTMRMVLGLLRPSAGTVATTGRVGYLPEVFTGYDAMGVRSYLRFCCRTRRIPDVAVDDALEATGAADLARRPIGRLSKGQRQRVGLAQAVLGSPGVLVLDEPTIGLDPEQVVDARRLIRATADAGAAVLVSTHVLAEAGATCDRALVVVDGRIADESDVAGGAELEERYLRLVGEARAS